MLHAQVIKRNAQESLKIGAFFFFFGKGLATLLQGFVTSALGVFFRGVDAMVEEEQEEQGDGVGGLLVGGPEDKGRDCQEDDGGGGGGGGERGSDFYR